MLLETNQNLPPICPTLDFELYLCQAFPKHFPYISFHQAYKEGGAIVIPTLQVSLLALRRCQHQDLNPGLSGSEFILDPLTEVLPAWVCPVPLME